MKHLLIVTGWITGAFLTLFVSLFTLVTLNPSHLPANLQNKVEAIADTQLISLSGVNGAVQGINTSVKTGDARPIIIDNYLERYNSPMRGYGTFITNRADELADQHNLNSTYISFLIIAIAQNESNLGKNMPPGCNNAWGWGIHKGGTLCFENWEEGINTVMTGIVEKYMIGRDLQTPEEIMNVYTPHSPEGAWAKSVNQFLDDLEHANF